ncbi:MAG: hypothetical protein ABI333_21150 [bacterium]
MSLSETLGSDFPRRCIVTNLAAGAVLALLATMYVSVGAGSGFAVGIILGSLHLGSWIGLGRQLLGPRDPLQIAVFLFFKLVFVYGGTVLYLKYEQQNAVAFVIGFSLIFFVILQKVLGRKLIASSKNLRSVT